MKLAEIHRHLDLATYFRKLAAWDPENPDPNIEISHCSMHPGKALRRAQKHEADALRLLADGAAAAARKKADRAAGVKRRRKKRAK